MIFLSSSVTSYCVVVEKQGDVRPAPRGDETGSAAWLELGGYAKESKARNQAGADVPVGLLNGAAQQGVVGPAQDAVGQFVPVEYGASAARTADKVNAARPASIRVDFTIDPLGIAERDGRRRPAKCPDRGRCGPALTPRTMASSTAILKKAFPDRVFRKRH